MSPLYRKSCPSLSLCLSLSLSLFIFLSLFLALLFPLSSLISPNFFLNYLCLVFFLLIYPFSLVFYLPLSVSLSLSLPLSLSLSPRPLAYYFFYLFLSLPRPNWPFLNVCVNFNQKCCKKGKPYIHVKEPSYLPMFLLRFSNSRFARMRNTI